MHRRNDTLVDGLHNADARHDRTPRTPLLLSIGWRARLESGDVGEQGVNLARFKRELRHGRMPDHDTFCQRLGQGLDRIPLGQVSEWWRKPHWTGTGFADGMASGGSTWQRSRDTCLAACVPSSRQRAHQGRAGVASSDRPAWRSSLAAPCPPWSSSRDQSDPGCELASSLERLRVGHRRRNGHRHDHAEAWDRLQPFARRIGAMDLMHALVEASDLHLPAVERRWLGRQSEHHSAAAHRWPLPRFASAAAAPRARSEPRADNGFGRSAV